MGKIRIKFIKYYLYRGKKIRILEMAKNFTEESYQISTRICTFRTKTCEQADDR